MKYKILAYPQKPLTQEHLAVLAKSHLKLIVGTANSCMAIVIEEYNSKQPLTKAELITIGHSLFPDKTIRPKIAADYIGPGFNIPIILVYDE